MLSCRIMANLSSRHPDRVEHADFTRVPLVDREDERVDHPEDVDEHRERQQDVEEGETFVEVLISCWIHSSRVSTRESGPEIACASCAVDSFVGSPSTSAQVQRLSGRS